MIKFLLVSALIVSQLLTWRAVVDMHNDLETLKYGVCGGGVASPPCHVIIDRSN
jgi:hypothetical protein